LRLLRDLHPQALEIFLDAALFHTIGVGLGEEIEGLDDLDELNLRLF